MTIPEQAVQAALETWPENGTPYDASAQMRAALTAAAPHLAAVRVTKLDWTKGVVDIAQPHPGMKYVACSTTPKGSWAWWLDNAPETRGVFTSEASAKAAAQADYEARILSALEPSAGRAAALEEALRVAKSELEAWMKCANEARIGVTSTPHVIDHIDMVLASHPVADKPDEAGAQGGVTAAASDVLAERSRQIEAEGWTPEHDDQHSNGEMAGAASCYALNGTTYKAPSHYPQRKVYAAVAEARRDAEKDMDSTREAIKMALGEPKAPKNWPWDAGWWKPSDRRRNLVKAGALILAEIERLDRLPTPPSGEVV